MFWDGTPKAEKPRVQSMQSLEIQKRFVEMVQDFAIGLSAPTIVSGVYHCGHIAEDTVHDCRIAVSHLSRF